MKWAKEKDKHIFIQIHTYVYKTKKSNKSSDTQRNNKYDKMG